MSGLKGIYKKDKMDILFLLILFEAVVNDIRRTDYSQTCVKQPHKGSTKSGCLKQVAA